MSKFNVGQQVSTSAKFATVEHEGAGILGELVEIDRAGVCPIYRVKFEWGITNCTEVDLSLFAPGKRVKIIFANWNPAGIQGDFGTLKERDGIIGDWAVDVEFPGALNEVVYFNETELELVEDAPTDTPVPIAATTVGAGRKPTYEELQAENALMAGRIEDLTGLKQSPVTA
jgi:hypothetical protein